MSHPQYFPVLDHELARIAELRANGLNPVYATFEDSLYDFWPDFAWNAEAEKEQVADLLASDLYVGAAAALKEERGWDFIAVLNSRGDE